MKPLDQLDVNEFDALVIPGYHTIILLNRLNANFKVALALLRICPIGLSRDPIVPLMKPLKKLSNHFTKPKNQWAFAVLHPTWPQRFSF